MSSSASDESADEVSASVHVRCGAAARGHLHLVLLARARSRVAFDLATFDFVTLPLREDNVATTNDKIAPSLRFESNNTALICSALTQSSSMVPQSNLSSLEKQNVFYQSGSHSIHLIPSIPSVDRSCSSLNPLRPHSLSPSLSTLSWRGMLLMHTIAAVLMKLFVVVLSVATTVLHLQHHQQQKL